MACRAWASAAAPIAGKRVMVVNRPGAGGVIAAAEVARSTPDGHTLSFFTPGPFVVQPHFEALQYQVPDSFVPILTQYINPIIIAAPADAPYGNLKELVAYAKANPGKLRYSASSLTGIERFGAERLQQATATILKSPDVLARLAADGGEVSLHARVVNLGGSIDTVANAVALAEHAAEKGAQAVQDSIKGMNEIREQIQETAKRIKRLSMPAALDLMKEIIAGRMHIDDVPADHPDIILIQDGIACLAQPFLKDRTSEYLGASDRQVVMVRRLWNSELKALDEGKSLTTWHVPRDLKTSRGI